MTANFLMFVGFREGVGRAGKGIRIRRLPLWANRFKKNSGM